MIISSLPIMTFLTSFITLCDIFSTFTCSSVKLLFIIFSFVLYVSFIFTIFVHIALTLYHKYNSISSILRDN